MRLATLIVTLLIISGCTTTQHYSGEPLPWSDKAIVLLEFSGDGVFEHYSGMRFSAVEPFGLDRSVRWDNTKLEFLPGRYRVELETWSKRTFASSVFAGASKESKTLKALQYGYNPNDRNNLEFNFEAGRIYVLHLEMKEVDGKAKRPIAYIEAY